MNYGSIAIVLLLLTIANGSAVIAKRILGDRFAWPVDGGARFIDGQPFFGRSKTIRGFLAGVTLTAIAAPFAGVDWRAGALIAFVAMSGDLLSSFIKRRMGRESSSRAVGLDQIPESLFPALLAIPVIGITSADAAAITILFFVGAPIASQVFYALKIRDRPY
jgi:CDP-2,3-bis-(O-geranylgeranyl)-sn-glycerol synthase